MFRTRALFGWILLAMIAAWPLSLRGADLEPEIAVAHLQMQSGRVDWLPQVDYERLTLTVSGPGGLILRREFGAGATPSFETIGNDGKPLPDGAYSYELVAAPVLDRETRRALATARRTADDSILEKLRTDGKLPRTPLVQSGSFTIAGGTILSQNVREQQSGGIGSKPSKTPAGLRPTTAEATIPDEVIIQGNNPRLEFDDTSTVPGFPNNDWQLKANDSASGGANKLTIEDLTGARVPVTIEAATPTNALYLDSTGRIGFRTATPALDLHVNTGNTPAIRLEQNSSGGFTAQSWDVAGNEANFFVRDVTGGSRLPFRIRPGAPTSSIDIAGGGNVGIGTATPDAKLDVESAGSVEIRMTITLGNVWQILNDSLGFGIQLAGAGFRAVNVDSAGNMQLHGTLTQGSSGDLKTDFASLDPQDVLARVNALPVSMWRYKLDAPQVRHVGPTAEDFHQAFGLGADDKHIAPSDQAGVALVAVQGLHQSLQDKAQEIDDLRRENAALTERIDRLETLISSLVEKKD
jgi:endosialidase-like protein